MNLSARLKTKCAEMASDGCLDELLDLVEEQAFTRWKVAPENVESHSAYEGQVELIQTMKNIGHSGMPQFTAGQAAQKVDLTDLELKYMFTAGQAAQK